MYGIHYQQSVYMLVVFRTSVYMFKNIQFYVCIPEYYIHIIE